jgi:hypothetical protein
MARFFASVVSLVTPVPGSAVLLMRSLAFNGVARIFVLVAVRNVLRGYVMRYVPCQWTVCLPSRLSNISAVTEAGKQITLAAFLYEQKLNYLNILNFIDINTIKDTIHNEIKFIRLDKKSEKS